MDSRTRKGEAWRERLAAQDVVLAFDGKRILGFMSLAPRGYVDFAYIRPDCQGTGLFRRLYARIEGLAVEQGLARLWVHASLTAQTAFTAAGFAIVKKERVSIGDQEFERFEMEKQLA